MLKELYIENIAVIEEARIDFEKGFNVLTGETGAGKSILIGSINAILGERVTRDMVRTGAEKASVTAVFSDIPKIVIEKLENDGYDTNDEENLIISRDIGSDGRSSCRIAGKPCNVSLVKDICSKMIAIHGQYDNVELLSSTEHLRYIDIYGATSRQKESYIKTYTQMMKTKTELANIHLDETEKEERIEMLTYQIEEISSANLKSGEEETLEEQKKTALNTVQILKGLQSAYAELFDTEDDMLEITGAVSRTMNASNQLSKISEYYEPAEKLATKLDEIYYELEEAAQELSSSLDDFELSTLEIDDIEYRLDEIYRLKHKYGRSVDEILEYLEEAKQELEDIQFSDEKVKHLEKRLEEETSETKKTADILSDIRNKSATKFSSEINDELKDLNMPDVKFTFSQDEKEFSPDGQDEIEFLISTNPGEPPKPISKIASGGELSRIMLAIKKVLAEKDDFETQIFDEIDTGVSGKTAEKIGLKLKEISKGRQIICVTHLAQIASLADTHLLIEKMVLGGRTYTEVRRLDDNERVREIARIIGGEQMTALTLANAKEMIRLGKEK